jgi:lipopolysaccharide biosynthesis protein
MTDEDFSAKDEVGKTTPYVYVVPNKGLDIGPFLFIVDKIKDKNYASIFKIHSKKSVKHSQPENFGELWRKALVNSLIGTEEVFDTVSSLIEENPDSMIGSKFFLYDFSRDGINIPHHYEVIHNTIKELGLEIRETKINGSTCFSNTGRFFAGTMFATSHEYLKRLFSNCDINKFYESLPEGYSYNSNAHALERIFGYYFEEIGGKFYTMQ